MNVDDLLSGFEPAFRARLERKVFESTIEGFSSLWPLMIWVIPIYIHLSYIAYYHATHGGSWLARILAGGFCVLAVASVFVYIKLVFNGSTKRLYRRYAQESGWSVAAFQKLAEEFPDRKKKAFLKQLERNLKEAAAFMA